MVWFVTCGFLDSYRSLTGAGFLRSECCWLGLSTICSLLVSIRLRITIFKKLFKIGSLLRVNIKLNWLAYCGLNGVLFMQQVTCTSCVTLTPKTYCPDNSFHSTSLRKCWISKVWGRNHVYSDIFLFCVVPLIFLCVLYFKWGNNIRL